MALIGSFEVAKRETAREDEDYEPDQIEFCGETFALADHVGAMPFLQFSAAATSGRTTADVEGDAALHALLRDTIDSDDFARFQAVATEHKATTTDLINVVRGIISARSGRPTRRPSDSADGPSPTGESSKEPSSSEGSSDPAEGAVELPADGTRPGQGPIMDDPRVRELRPIDDAARELALTS